MRIGKRATKNGGVGQGGRRGRRDHAERERETAVTAVRCIAGTKKYREYGSSVAMQMRLDPNVARRDSGDNGSGGTDEQGDGVRWVVKVRGILYDPGGSYGGRGLGAIA